MINDRRAWIAVFLVVAATALAACGKQPEPQEEIRPVRTMVISTTATTLSNTYAGEVRARYESALGFRVAGKMVARKVDVGTAVKAGQVLAQLDPKDLQLSANSAAAQVAAAQAQANVAKLDFDRVQNLHTKGFASQAELDRNSTQYQASKAQLDAVIAQSRQVANQTGYATLVADSNGVVTAILAEAGQVVAAGQPVVRIARDGEVEILASVPEDRIATVKEGQAVTISLWTVAGKSFAGKVREVGSAADAYTRTYTVRVSIPTPPPEMKLGMTASITIPLAAPSLVHVPSSAMVPREGKAGVWVLDEKAMMVHFRPAKFVGVEANDVLIGEGLSAGDVIVTAGAALLQEGQKVRHMVQATPTASAAP
jgi:RND family efflux transporter MFP subunit